MKKGIYIVIEGIDGSGKTTLAENLKERLEEIEVPVVCVKEPYNEKLKEVIAQVKKEEPIDEEAILSALFAADRLILKQEIFDYTTAGINVISDRSKLSSFAYQKVDPHYNNFVNHYMLDPDVLFYLDIEPEEAKKRYEGTDKFENVHNLKKVRTWYTNFLPVIADEYGIPFARLKVSGFSPEEVTDYFFDALKQLNVIGG
jgi:dTMP kinase